jgi:N-acetylmuramoyl-L-alanine amidase
MNNEFNYNNFNNSLLDDVEIIDFDDCDIEIIEIDDEVSFDLPRYDKKISKSFLSKVREKLSVNKFAVISTCAVTLIVTLTGVFLLNFGSNGSSFKSHNSIVYSNENLDNIDFRLNDSQYNTISVNTPYEEKGASLFIDGVDYSSLVSIDSSNLDIGHVGTYHISYTYVSDLNQVRTLYRTIRVVDNESPVITMLGSNVYTMLVNDTYDEAGVLVSDNSLEDLSGKVIIESNLNTSYPGVYSIKYSVKDSSGNESFIVRTVIVRYSYVNNSNSIISNSFTENALFLKGSYSNYGFQNRIMLKNKTTGEEFVYDVSNNGGYYQMFLDVNTLSNGDYDFYLINNSLEPICANLTDFNKLVRAHVGNKLVTMNYDKNLLSMSVEDFSYQYDIVIDPGHGGSDFGAVNGNYYEKSINLEQSLYEKARFEAHGLKVLLLRESDYDYGVVMGKENWDMIDRKAYAVGYYGSVSRIVYSNHHNSSGNSSSAGWEILVPSYASYDDLALEHKIADIWSQMYIDVTDPYYRFYTKDFSNGSCNNKMNGEVYSFDDYYSVIRVPHKMFNVSNVLYEGAYINNSSDMYWYYNLGNWKMLSEVKIKAYVESLGIEYIEP